MKLGTKVKIVNIDEVFSFYEEMFKYLRFKNTKSNRLFDCSGVWETFSPVVKHFEDEDFMVAIQKEDKQVLIGIKGIEELSNSECFMEDINSLKISPKEKERLLYFLEFHGKM